MFPVAGFPVFDVVVPVDAFGDIVWEFDFLNAAPDDGLSSVGGVEREMEGILPAIGVMGREWKGRPCL